MKKQFLSTVIRDNNTVTLNIILFVEITEEISYHANVVLIYKTIYYILLYNFYKTIFSTEYVNIFEVNIEWWFKFPIDFL